MKVIILDGLDRDAPTAWVGRTFCSLVTRLQVRPMIKSRATLGLIITRRWLRLSLRGLMAVVMIVGSLAGWIAHTIRTQRQAIAVVRTAGGTLVFNYQSQQVVNGQGHLVRRREPAAPIWIRRWVGDELFQHVTKVNFDQPVSPELIEAVVKFDRLEGLTWHDTHNSADLSRLAGLFKLRSVQISGPSVTDRMLAQIAQVP